MPLQALAPTVLRLVAVDGSGGLAAYAFISCAREDSAAADVVQAALEQAGIGVWRDAAEVWPGEDRGAAIRRAVSGGAVAFHAAALASHAEAAARSITIPHRHAQVLVQVAGALATAGQHAHAEAAAHSIVDPYLQAQALAQVAGALAIAGPHEHAEALAGQAEAVARSITYPGFTEADYARLLDAAHQSSPGPSW